MTVFQEAAGLSRLRPDDPREVAGYRLLARIGEGGMGSVYLSHTRGGQPVALKVVRRELAQDEEFRRRFQQEVRAARQVQGYHVVPVVDHDTTGSRPWLATSYVPGMPLDAALAAYGPLPLAAVLRLVGCVAEALRAVHAADVVHRDLKPGNVLLGADGPWVIDFGIARAADHTQLTRSGHLIGTPQYMSPEHANGEALTAATDVFSLGLIAAVAATGRHPYGDGGGITTAARIANTETRPPDLSGYPDGLRPLLEGCLAADPAGRPGAEELARLCERGAGRSLRDLDGWLPGPLAADIARRADAARQVSSGDFGPGSGGPGAGADAGSASYTPTEPVHPGGPADPGRFASAPTRTAQVRPAAVGAGGGGRRAAIVGAVIAAVVVGGLLYALAAPGDAPGGAPAPTPPVAGSTPPVTPQSTGPRGATSAPAYQVLLQGVPLSVSPPDTISSGVQVDLDAPKVDPTHQMSGSDAEFNYSDDYLTFNTPTGKAASATPQACLTAANTTPLPAQLPGKALGPGNAIRAGDVLCTVTSKGNLAMWQISDAQPTANYFRTPAFTGRLTLWKLPAGAGGHGGQ